MHLTYFLTVEQQIGFFKRRTVQDPSNKENRTQLLYGRIFGTKLKVHFRDVKHGELSLHKLAKEYFALSSPVMVVEMV